MPAQPSSAAPPPRPDQPAGVPVLRHGFTDVDAQPAPADWVVVLDRVASEPFYAAYKRRIRHLLHPRPAGRYLEVGAGTGADAAQLATTTGATVVAMDRAITMAATARDRGLAWVVAADAHDLPFADHTFHGGWADRVLQHLTDPAQALGELVRVTLPGGRVVVADPDYDTQVLDLADQQLARRVLRFRADHMLRNGTLAHRHAGLLAARGLTDVQVEAHTLVVRDHEAEHDTGRKAAPQGTRGGARRPTRFHGRVISDTAVRPVTKPTTSPARSPTARPGGPRRHR